MQCPRILVITGPRGSGKTSMVDVLDARGVAGAAFYHFDSSRAATASRRSDSQPLEAIVARLAESSTLSVLEGEIPLSAAKAAFSRFNVDGHLLLVVASCEVRTARLGASALPSNDQAGTAAFSREADSLATTVIDTSQLALEEAAELLHGHVAALAAV